MKKSISLLIALIGGLFILLSSCEEKPNSDNITQTDQVDFDLEKMQKGFNLLNTACFSCHNPNSELENKIAPSFKDIKSVYKSISKSEEEFIEMFREFTLDPSPANAKVVGAVKEYGTMPKMNFSDIELDYMAYFIYHSNIETKSWFLNFELEKQKYAESGSKDNFSYLKHGKELAMKTKSTLGKNLLGTIKKSGTDAAIEFCNIKASHLTDSMSGVLNAHIKRVSDFPRNSSNKANENELKYIQLTKELLSKGKTIKGMTQEIDGKTVAYYPITTNNMCLQCHGIVNTEIQPSTMLLLKEKYPNDMATGYGENELRGIWVIEFEE